MGRGRPAGKKNKSQFRMVTLGELNEILQPTAKIPIKRDYVDVLLATEEEEDENVEDNTEDTEEEEESAISVIRHIPENKE